MDNNYLEKERIGKLLLKFSIPCILSLLISALYNIVDQIFIGNSDVGAIGNTATTIVFPLTCIALAFALMLGDGAASYISLRLGEGNKAKIKKCVGSTLAVAIILCILFLVICFPNLSAILTLFGASTPEALSYSLQYGYIILIGIPFYFIMNTMNSIIRADGAPAVAMISMTVGAVLNIIFDAVFILGLDWGVKGAAIATITGQIVSFIISTIYMIRPRNFKLDFKSFKVEWKIILSVCKLGLSSFLTQASIVVETVVSMNMLAKYGALSEYGADDPQAILGIVMKVFTIVVNIAVGIAAGAQPIVGYNYGAGRIDRVKKLYKWIIISNLVLGAIATILFETIPSQIVSVFGSNTDNPELYLQFGVLAMRIFLSLILFTVLQKVSSIFLQSIGSPVKATALSLFRDVIIICPMMVILPIFFGIEGVLYSAIVGDVLGIILTIILMVIQFKKFNKLEKEIKLEKKEKLEKIEPITA